MSNHFMPSRFFRELKEREGMKSKLRTSRSRMVSSEGVAGESEGEKSGESGDTD